MSLTLLCVDQIADLSSHFKPDGPADKKSKKMQDEKTARQTAQGDLSITIHYYTMCSLNCLSGFIDMMDSHSHIFFIMLLSPLHHDLFSLTHILHTLAISIPLWSIPYLCIYVADKAAAATAAAAAANAEKQATAAAAAATAAAEKKTEKTSEKSAVKDKAPAKTSEKTTTTTTKVEVEKTEEKKAADPNAMVEEVGAYVLLILGVVAVISSHHHHHILSFYYFSNTSPPIHFYPIFLIILHHFYFHLLPLFTHFTLGGNSEWSRASSIRNNNSNHWWQ